MEFNVGDRVRYVIGDSPAAFKAWVGKTGVVEAQPLLDNSAQVQVAWDDWNGRFVEERSGWPFTANLELVKE